MKYVLALGVTAILIFAVFFLKIISPSHEEKKPRIFAVSAADVSSFAFENSNGVIELFKKEGEWFVDYRNFLEPAFEKFTVQYLNNILNLRPNYFFLPEEPASSYGLEPPNAVIRVNSARGTTTLNLGDLAPTGKEHYAMISGDKRIHMVPMVEIENYDMLTAEDFKFRNVMPVAFDQIEEIDFELMDDKYKLISEREKIVVRSGTKREETLSYEEFKELVAAINHISVQNVIPIKPEDVRFFKFSLEYPLISINVTEKDGKIREMSFSQYAGHYLDEVNEEAPSIRTFEPETVEGFLNKFDKIVKNRF